MSEEFVNTSDGIPVMCSQYTHALVSGIPKFIISQENQAAEEQHKKFTK